MISGDGYFRFENVPPGTYLIESNVTRFGGPSSGTQGGSTLVQTDTPNGPQLSTIGGPYVVGGKAPSDDYIVIGKFPVTIEPGVTGSFTFAPGDFKIIAHAYDS